MEKLLEQHRLKLPKILATHLPSFSVSYVLDLLLQYPVLFHVHAPRKSKLGDFRPIQKHYQFHHITVNQNLEPYTFLITTLHEIAHLITYVRYQNTVAGHGKEWKHCFSLLIADFLDKNYFPPLIEQALKHYAKNMKATSCSDVQLQKALLLSENPEAVTLDTLPMGQKFMLQGNIFQKISKQRTRYLCLNLNNKQHYCVLAHVPIQPL
jgi:SprT protein